MVYTLLFSLSLQNALLLRGQEEKWLLSNRGILFPILGRVGKKRNFTSFCFVFRLCGNFFLSTLVFIFRYPSTTSPFSSSELLLTQGQVVAHKHRELARALRSLRSLSKLRGVSCIYIAAKFKITVSGNGRNTP